MTKEEIATLFDDVANAVRDASSSDDLQDAIDEANRAIEALGNLDLGDE